MRLSIIIVNYNVKYFLEQCLLSVRRAFEGIDAEVIVIDNASSDGSTQMLSKRFPDVRLIANADNVGFAKANNQGIREAAGEFILLLNPDTVVQEDTLSKCLAFMDTHSDAGALGVKMLDGTGKFLPESKRGLPTPRVSAFKVFGISKLFPKSKTFNRYHLGHLSENETHSVDVLAGAFMMIRRKVMDQIGLLDENFFMYGEDIDLSYRITQAGYRNYYFPETSIIHYKGESTKKGSLNYVRMFYQAMILFAEKHYSKGQARMYRVAIRSAVYLKAASAGVSRLMRSLWLPVIEAGFIFGGIYLIKDIYALRVKDAAEYYPEEFMYYIVPIYIAIWITATFFSGGYDKPLRISRALRGVFVGTIIIAAVYGFLPESLRYSRAIIILGAAWAGFMAIVLRALALMVRSKSLRFTAHRSKRLVIVGGTPEGQRVLNMLNQTTSGHNFIGFISPSPTNGATFSAVINAGETSQPSPAESRNDRAVIGDLSDLDYLAEVYALDEVVFCAKDVPTRSIILRMGQNPQSLTYKIASEESQGIIGSNSKKTAGDLYAVDANLAINQPGNRRSKRLFDVMICLAVIVFLPISLVVISNSGGWLRNWLHVFIGKKSWVGYAPATNSLMMLPKLRPGVLSPATRWHNRQLDPSTRERLNLLYARDYSVQEDWRIIWNCVKELGR